MDYKWKLEKLNTIKKNGLKVFSCFSSGGGSSMGYKLAGYEIIGCVDIDKKMIENYLHNVGAKNHYNMDIRDFNKLLKEYGLPEHLKNLDILDGSPPCTTFSTAGLREKSYGVKKKFREGQKEQTLDDLYFEFIETTKLIKPKVVISENVKGLTIGTAKEYFNRILKGFNDIGYRNMYSIINAIDCGVPQNRERLFIISVREDVLSELNGVYLDLEFRKKEIGFEQATKEFWHEKRQMCKKNGVVYDAWHKAKELVS